MLPYDATDNLCPSSLEAEGSQSNIVDGKEALSLSKSERGMVGGGQT